MNIQLSNVAFKRGITRPHQVVLQFIFVSGNTTQGGGHSHRGGNGIQQITDLQKADNICVLRNNPRVSLGSVERVTEVVKSNIQPFFGLVLRVSQY